MPFAATPPRIHFAAGDTLQPLAITPAGVQARTEAN